MEQLCYTPLILLGVRYFPAILISTLLILTSCRLSWSKSTKQAEQVQNHTVFSYQYKTATPQPFTYQNSVKCEMVKDIKTTSSQYCTEVQHRTKKHTHININIQFTQLDWSLSVISYTHVTQIVPALKPIKTKSVSSLCHFFFYFHRILLITCFFPPHVIVWFQLINGGKC